MSNQLDASPERIQLAQQKAERKLFLRNEFLKQKFDPFQHATGEAGTVFDNAFIRYHAMQVSVYDFFKPSGRNIMLGLGCLLLPMFAAGFIINNSRNRIEARYRRGEVAYKDRKFKFV